MVLNHHHQTLQKKIASVNNLLKCLQSNNVPPFCNHEAYLCLAFSKSRLSNSGSRLFRHPDTILYCLTSRSSLEDYSGRISNVAFYKFAQSSPTNRMFYVKMDDCYSAERSVHNGVLHGSVIGLYFFNYYMHDLPEITSCEYFQYADDTSIITFTSIQLYRTTCTVARRGKLWVFLMKYAALDARGKRTFTPGRENLLALPRFDSVTLGMLGRDLDHSITLQYFHKWRACREQVASCSWQSSCLV